MTAAASRRDITLRALRQLLTTRRVRSTFERMLPSGSGLQHKRQLYLLSSQGNCRALAATGSFRLAQRQQPRLSQRPNVTADGDAVPLHPLSKRPNRRETATLPHRLEQLISTRREHGEQRAYGLETHGGNRGRSQAFEATRRPPLHPFEERVFWLDAHLKHPSRFGVPSRAWGCLRRLAFVSHRSRRFLFGAQNNSHGA